MAKQWQNKRLEHMIHSRVLALGLVLDQMGQMRGYGFDRFLSFLSNRFLGSLGFFTRSASVTAKTRPPIIRLALLLLRLTYVSASG
jgi:hypothetical protein